MSQIQYSSLLLDSITRNYSREYFVNLYQDSIFRSGYADLFLPLIQICRVKTAERKMSPYVYELILREIDNFIYYVFFTAQIQDCGIQDVVWELTDRVKRERN